MAEGSTHKTCPCRDPQGRRLGPRCPQLRRGPGGPWSASHGWWAYQLELPHLPDGPRRQLRRTGFPTRDAATAERTHALELLALARDNLTVAVQIADELRGLRSNRPLPDRDTVARRVRAGLPAAAEDTLAAYLWQWHASRKIEPTTLHNYEVHIRLHLVPHLGHLAVDQLRPAHIQDMFDAIAARNAEILAARTSPDPAVRDTVKGVRTVGPATMHRIRGCLRKALNDAIRRHRIIEFNPAAHVELPSGKRPKARVWSDGNIAAWRRTGRKPSPVMVWTPAQAGAFLDHAQDADPQLYALYTLILHRGLRRGEAVGLRDTDLDLTRGVAVISQQITTCGSAVLTKKVKSDAGDRTVPLDQVTTAALRGYRAQRASRQLAAGAHWPDTGLFFVRPDGHPWHPDMVTRRFYRLVGSADLPPIRLHDLRHCAATFLKAAGADLKDIQATLGHSSIAITADTYTSVIHELDSERRKADAAAALVPRSRQAG